MSTNNNRRKSEFLGMPHGTANNRLRKLILFDLLVRHDENVCFKCGEHIVTAEELSIEHKQPWEGRSVELFWDLGNIAFSHLRCNRPESFNPANKIVCPAGTNWCGDCKAFIPVEKFHASPNKRLGLQNYCIEHVRQRRLAREKIKGD